MLNDANRSHLMDAMVLLEIEGGLYPSMIGFFNEFDSKAVVFAVHDIVQHVHSGGEIPLEASTNQILRKLHSAQQLTPSQLDQLLAAQASGTQADAHSRPSVIARVLKRLKTKSLDAA